MNKMDLIRAVAKKEDVTLKDTERILNRAFDIMVETLSGHEDVTLSGLGRFYVRRTPERNGTIPGTNTPMKIPARYNLTFNMSQRLRDGMNQSREE